MKKRFTVLLASLLISFSSVSLASCNDNTSSQITTKTSYVDTTKDSIYGKIDDFNLENNDSLSAGQVLQFRVTPSDDFSIDAVTVNGEAATPIENKAGYYSYTLKSGKNKIAATYKIDATKDFVEAFKLNISDELFNQVMQDPPSSKADKVNGLDFRRDGIEQVMTSTTDPKNYFINYVDGDTTHVNSRNYGYSIKIRYLGIDTPESTSEIEEWGKSASNYNKAQLSTAKHIILESQGTSFDGQKHESTVDGNQRSLAYVWYTDKANPTKDDFKCLNLEMVYQGFSSGIGSLSNMGETFYKAFDKANKSAQANKRHLYSNDVDPNYYYGDPADLTLKQLYQTTKTGVDSPLADNKTLYRIKGYVSRRLDTAFYFQDKTSYEQSGTSLPEAYGMYVFTYAETPIKEGDEVEVIGVISSYGGSYQMMGISYHNISPNENRDTRIISSGHEIKPIKVSGANFSSSSFTQSGLNNVLVEFEEDLYCYNKTSTHQGVTSDSGEGGLEEINKYNENYPFYNTSNKIIGYAKYGSSSGDEIRFVSSEDALFDYNGQVAKSYKFFTGGTLLYNAKGAEYANKDSDNEYASETVETTYKAKQMHVVAISSYYISTSGTTTAYTANLVSKKDVTFKGEL